MVKVGDKIGRFTVAKILPAIGNQRTIRYECHCKCGRVRHYIRSQLKRVRSCGNSPCVGSRLGLSKHPLYSVWHNMISRCHNKKNHAYANYGGRGIRVCKEWRNSVKIFIKWGEKNGFKKGLQLDRKKNHKGYRPDNCRFVSQKRNLANRRRKILVCKNDYRDLLASLQVSDSKRRKEEIGKFLRKIGLWEIADVM